MPEVRANLAIAKLDRLARNAHFVSGLMQSRVKFVACDLPEANQLTIHIMAAFAEHEAGRTSERTRELLPLRKLGVWSWARQAQPISKDTP
jgi:DNA invertase Pin-like site-specific DNA recombinase